MLQTAVGCNSSCVTSLAGFLSVLTANTVQFSVVQLIVYIVADFSRLHFSFHLYGRFPLALGAVEEEAGDGLPGDEGVLVSHLGCQVCKVLFAVFKMLCWFPRFSQFKKGKS